MVPWVEGGNGGDDDVHGDDGAQGNDGAGHGSHVHASEEVEMGGMEGVGPASGSVVH